jgi:hypothetical protein
MNKYIKDIKELNISGLDVTIEQIMNIQNYENIQILLDH